MKANLTGQYPRLPHDEESFEIDKNTIKVMHRGNYMEVDKQPYYLFNATADSYISSLYDYRVGTETVQVFDYKNKVYIIDFDTTIIIEYICNKHSRKKRTK